MVKENGVGLSLYDDCVEKILALTNEELYIMRENVKKVFNDNFTEDMICAKFGCYLNEIIK